MLSVRNALRAAVVVLILLVGGVLALIGERLLASPPPPNETRVATFTDWQVICPPFNPAQPNCALTLDVLRDTGGVLLTVSMLDPAPNSSLSVTVPHGVALDAGMGFTVGTDPMRVRPFETCNNTGCIAPGDGRCRHAEDAQHQHGRAGYSCRGRPNPARDDPLLAERICPRLRRASAGQGETDIGLWISQSLKRTRED